MGAIQAARMGDAVGAHASHFWGWVGMAAGILLGAVLGAVLIVATGGMAAPALMGALLMISAVSGGVALAATGGVWLGRFAHSFDKPPPPEGASPCGTITIGLATVKIEGQLAARMSDPTTHNGSMLRQGSKTVVMKGKPATRYKDLSSCSGMVIKSATNTFFGGPPADNGASTGDGSAFDEELDRLQELGKIASTISMIAAGAAVLVGASLGGVALFLGKSMPAILMKSLPLLGEEAGTVVVRDAVVVTGQQALKASAYMGVGQAGMEGAGRYVVEPGMGALGNKIDGEGPGVGQSMADAWNKDFGSKEEKERIESEEDAEQNDLVGHRWHNFMSGGSGFLMAFAAHKAGEYFFEKGEHAGGGHGGGGHGGGGPHAPVADPAVAGAPAAHPCTTCAGAEAAPVPAATHAPAPEGGGATPAGGHAAPAGGDAAPAPAANPATTAKTTADDEGAPVTVKSPGGGSAAEGSPTPADPAAATTETTPKTGSPKPKPEIEDQTNKTDGETESPETPETAGATPKSKEDEAAAAATEHAEEAAAQAKKECTTCSAADEAPNATELADEVAAKVKAELKDVDPLVLERVLKMPVDFQEEYLEARANGWKWTAETTPDPVKFPPGSNRYPPNMGGIGAPVRTTIGPGSANPDIMQVDRYGHEGGVFVGRPGDAFEARALPGDPPADDPNVYNIKKPTLVDKSEIAPWFDQPGGGEQYQLVHPEEAVDENGDPIEYKVAHARSAKYIAKDGDDGP